MSEDKGTAKKGRPTPKRRDAERKNRRPLVMSRELTKEEKKEAKALKRKQRDEAYMRRRAALEGRGDERYLPAQDQGRDRRFVREYIDARWSFSEFILPIMIVAMVVSLVAQAMKISGTLPVILLAIMYVSIILGVIEMVYVTRKLKRLLRENFNIPKPKIGFYVFTRMVAIRPWRSPRPTNKRGEFPRGSRG